MAAPQYSMNNNEFSKAIVDAREYYFDSMRAAFAAVPTSRCKLNDDAFKGQEKNFYGQT